MLRIDELLQQSGEAGSSERLDAEILLSHLLNKDRSYLYAWPERELDPATCAELERQLGLRDDGVPVAYLVGEREFWSLALEVDRNTLIPRPETELVVEWALQLPLPRTAQVVDLGTGSGAIALALASERLNWDLLACDISREALAVARRNIQKLRPGNVQLLESDWLEGLGDRRFSLIVSNPPYIAEGDPHLLEGGLPYEPPAALSSGVDGLDDIRRIVSAAPANLLPGGWLLLEHSFDQAPRVRDLLLQAGFSDVSSRRDLAGHERVSGGRWSAQ